MTTYYITLFLVILFAAQAQHNDRPRPSNYNDLRVLHSQAAGIFFFFSIIVLVLVSGFRYYVGTDYGTYYHGYRAYGDILGKAIRTLNEPGYPLICRVAVLFHGDGATAIFLSSLLMIWPALRVIYRHTDRLLLAVLLYVFLGCWSGGFNGIRQYLAATMLFCGYESLAAKDLKKYCFFVFVAFLFHRSAIVMLALFFVVHQKINLRNVFFLIIGSVILFFLYDKMLTIAGWITEKEYSLENAYTSRTVNSLRVMAACMPAVVFLALLWKQPKDKQTTFYLNLLVIHAVLRIATMSSALLYRVGIYTTLFQVIAIPELLKKVSPKNAKPVLVAMIPLYACFWWYEIANNASLRNFHWIWQR